MPILALDGRHKFRLTTRTYLAVRDNTGRVCIYNCRSSLTTGCTCTGSVPPHVRNAVVENGPHKAELEKEHYYLSKGENKSLSNNTRACNHDKATDAIIHGRIPYVGWTGG